MAESAQHPVKAAIERAYLFFGRRQNARWVEATSQWVERNIMTPRRQWRRRREATNESTEAYLKT
ncbi:MAG TPA: hypothetical protein VL492_00980, partial [Methylovirgula sp.]|nr:hypothetical protein [Methylovirgula sp.]